MQPWCTPLPILNPSIALCSVLNIGFWLAYKFLKRKVRLSGIPVSSRILQFCNLQSFVVCSTVFVICTVVSSRFCSTLSCSVMSDSLWPHGLHSLPDPSLHGDSLCHPVDVGNLISGFAAFSKSSLYNWKFLVHILLKSSLKDFEL